MPPQISDDEENSVSVSPSVSPEPEHEPTPPATTKSRGRPAKEELKPVKIESDNEDEDEDEQAEDEYVVEKILKHVIEPHTNEIKYQVKWEGFDKAADLTWEPEANLETASKILNEYLDSVGGKEKLMKDWEELQSGLTEKKAGKKRGRPSTGTPQANGAKKSKKNSATTSMSPPAGVRAADFKPPTGSWEDDVVAIDACEGKSGDVIVYLTWKGGHKSQHTLSQIYKRCPQKMLRFYESHLVFKKTDTDAED